MKPPYADYCKHAMRFYARSMMNAHSAEPRFKTEADKKNWYACQAAVRTFSPEDMDMLITLYGMSEPLPDAISRLAKDKRIHPDRVWNIVNDLERKIAKRRGLI